jgi:hypothetical protein
MRPSGSWRTSLLVACSQLREPTLSVEAIAVGLIAGRAEYLDRARARIEAVEAVAGSVAKDEDAVVSAPNWTFGEAKSARTRRHWLVADNVRQLESRTSK